MKICFSFIDDETRVPAARVSLCHSKVVRGQMETEALPTSLVSRLEGGAKGARGPESSAEDPSHLLIVRSRR